MNSGALKLWHRFRHLVTAFFISLLLASPVSAHSEDSSEAHRHGDSAAKDAEVKVGVDEKLGAKIPLNLAFCDETGKHIRLVDLVTGPTIILPVYYSCTNVCNYLQGGLARVLPAVKKKPGSEYRIISVSFDETETPQQAVKMQRMYLTAMGIPFPESGWRFLTGDTDNIRKLTDAVGYRFQRKGRDFIHPMTSVVLTGDGTIVRYLYGTTFLAKDISLALLEAQAGKTGKTIRTAMDYCFSFDPAGKTYVFNLLRVSATVVITCVGSFMIFLLVTGNRAKRKKPEDT